MLQRGGLPSEITLPGETSSPELCIEGRCGLRKTEKIFSANNEQGSLNRGKKSGFQKILDKILTSKIFGPSRSRDVPPVSGAPASELVLQREDLPSEIALP